MTEWPRRLLRLCAQRLAPFGERVGTRVLANPRLRRILNAAYERRWPVVATVVTRFFATSSISVPFVWRARLRSGALLVPVAAGEQRSWANALLWRWPPNLPVRHFYEDYVEYRRAASPGTRDLLLDVGANDGLHSCLFALAGWECVAFEPQPCCIAEVKRISELNQFEHVSTEQCVVGDRAATDIEFYVSQSTWFSSLDRTCVERFEPAQPIQVEMITLDSYCSARNLAPTCVKIDVEGREVLVLRGAQCLLERIRPDLVIEASADAGIRAAIWDLLMPLGYQAYALTQGGLPALRSMPDLGTFVAAGPGAEHVDAVFTADQALGARLDVGLARRSHRGVTRGRDRARALSGDPR